MKMECLESISTTDQWFARRGTERAQLCATHPNFKTRGG
jgi:hypothetical protein